MLKLEIKLDEAKIKSEHKYDVISIYQTLEKSFFKFICCPVSLLP